MKIKLPDWKTEKRASNFLLSRFSSRVFKSDEHLVQVAKLKALAVKNISYIVKGKTTYEQQLAAIRGAAIAKIK